MEEAETQKTGPNTPKPTNEPNIVMYKDIVYADLPSSQFVTSQDVLQSSVVNTTEITNNQKKSLENTGKKSLKKTLGEKIWRIHSHKID